MIQLIQTNKSTINNDKMKTETPRNDNWQKIDRGYYYNF